MKTEDGQMGFGKIILSRLVRGYVLSGGDAEEGYKYQPKTEPKSFYYVKILTNSTPLVKKHCPI